jgi:colicin import membrane protein
VSKTFRVALGLSITLHVLLGIGLLLGNFTHKPKKPKSVASVMEPIQAVAVDKNKVAEQVKKIKKKKADDARKLRELENKVASAKKNRAKEEQRIKKLEKQRKQKEVEKKKADVAAKKAKSKADAAEKYRKKKVAEKKKADKAAADAKAKRIKEEVAAKKAEDLRKKKAEDKKRQEKLAKERERQDRLLAEQMELEMKSRQRARSQQVMTEIGRYTSLIKQTIMRNLITDRSTMEGKSCKLSISLAPSGFVTNVQLGQGDPTVCAASKTAILKAGTLPVSKDPEVFKEMKTITLIVVPEF